MFHNLSQSLSNELKAFIERNTGEGAPYATPCELVVEALFEKQERMEAVRIRNAVLEGYADLRAGRAVHYRGNLRQLL